MRTSVVVLGGFAVATVVACVGDQVITPNDAGSDATASDVAVNDVVTQDVKGDASPTPDAGSWCSKMDGSTWCEDFDESNALPSDLTVAIVGDAGAPFVASNDPSSPPNSLFASAPGTSVVNTYVASAALPPPTTSFALDWEMKCTHSGSIANAGPVVYLISTDATNSVALRFESGTVTAVFASVPADAGLSVVTGTSSTFNCDTAFHHFNLQVTKGAPSTMTLTVDNLVASQLTTTSLVFGKLYVDVGVGVASSAMTMNLDNIVLYSN